MSLRDLEADLERDGEVLVHKLEEWAEAREERTFFYYGEEDRRLSFGEFNALANAIAHNLSSMDIAKGDRISLFLMNPLVTALSMVGMWKIGAVYCPINFNYHGRLLSYQINDTQPKLLIAEQGRVAALNQIEAEIPHLPVVLHQPAEGEHDFDAGCADTALHASFVRTDFRDLLEGDTSNPGIAIDYRDTANIIYTSGTTGPAKGVVQPHRWIHNYIYYNLKFIHPYDVVHNDLPLYHVGGAFANIGRAAWGGCAVAVWDRFSPGEFWKRIERAGATSAILLDVMMPWLLIPEETPQDRRNTLKQVHMQPLPEYHHAFARRFGIDVVSVGYGQTEAGAGFVGLIDEFGEEEATPPELLRGYTREDAWKIAGALGVPVLRGDSKIKKGFMGKPSLLFEAAVLDENDRELGPERHGQLALRPRLPHLLLEEYFNKLEATLGVFRNLWFHTGDGGYKDGDGNYYFVDRMGGFIRRKGENISSYQIEDIVTGHPQVGVCAAFPVPADEGEEDDIVVYVVPQGELSEEELRVWMRAEMPKFMQPQHVRFVDALPQTPTYKVEKYKLKRQFLQESGKEGGPVRETETKSGGTAVAVEDRIQIEQLLHRYCHALDRGSIDEVVGLFHPDAVLLPVYESDARYVGREAVRGWYENYDRTLRANVRYLRHKISCPAIEVSESAATSVCYLDADAIPAGFEEPIVLVGRYDDKLVREAGRWWFQERKIIGYYSHPAGKFSPGRGE